MAATQKRVTDADELARLRIINNPTSARIGPFTGRCTFCASTDIWDDNLAWGCNCCGSLCGSNF